MPTNQFVEPAQRRGDPPGSTVDHVLNNLRVECGLHSELGEILLLRKLMAHEAEFERKVPSFQIA